MLLEDDETQTLACKTVKRCSKTSWLQNDSYPTAPCALAEILPETTVRAQFDKIEIFSHTTNLLTVLTFLHFEIPYMYTHGESQSASLGFGLWAKTLREAKTLQGQKLYLYHCLWLQLWFSSGSHKSSFVVSFRA